MESKDLRRIPPRRWNEEIGGIKWLPRLIDKARAAHAGKLGGYLFGQSPMDTELLRTLALSHRSFAEIVRLSADDVAVLEEIVRCDPRALARGRAWSATMASRHRVFLAAIDIDDGYSSRWLFLKRPANLASNALTWTIKRMWPSRATPPSSGR